jgi:hypothetical protein
VSAARHGLADRVLQRSAVTVFELALAALPGLEPPGWLSDDLAVMLARRVRRGLCPADLDPADPGTAGRVPPDPDPSDPDPDPAEFVPHRPAVAPGDPEEARA